MPDEQDPGVGALRAIAHPVRLRILSLLTGAEMSAAEVARELGIAHASASYHLRVLADAGEVVEAGEEHIRGGVAKRYRHPWQRATEGQPSSPAEPVRPTRDDAGLALYARAMADELVRRTALRRPDTRSFLADAETWVPPEAWERAVALVQEASTLVHSEARHPRTAGTVHVNLSVALFEMTDAPGQP
jgi:DNA-binding transcriptional ArsR family regulator